MIALIPARGGSKGLPKKNIKLLGGKPLIQYTIDAALKSANISRVVVSTDDIEIASIAKNCGAEVPFMRPDYLSDDGSKAIDVYTHAIDYFETKNELKALVVLLPTCPFRVSEDVDKAIDLFNHKKADSVVSYTEEYHPIAWHKKLSSDFRFKEIFEQNELKNRQDYEKSYFPNGAIYVFKTSLLKQGDYYSNNSFAYVMPRERSLDIDTEADFNYAEFLYEKWKNQ